MSKKLNPKQKAFISEYLVDLNATQAAIKAGYSVKTAKQIGSKLLTKVDIKTEIARQIKEREQKTGITADYVLKSIKEVAERCMQAVPVVDRKGNRTGEWQFDSSGANTALANLGKHLKLFTEKVEAEIHTDHSAKELTDDELSGIISRGRSEGAAGASQSSPEPS